MAEVDTELEAQGVDGFVAHKDIEPSREWAEEIELALRSCMLVRRSSIPVSGTANGRIRRSGFVLAAALLSCQSAGGLDPYGPMGRYQGIAAVGRTPRTIAIDIVDALISNDLTQPDIAPVVARRFADATSQARAVNWMNRLEGIRKMSPGLLQTINDAPLTNENIRSADGLSARVARLLERHGYEAPAVPAYDYGEEPF